MAISNNTNIELQDLINLATSEVKLSENCVDNFTNFMDGLKKSPASEQVDKINQCIAQVREIKQEQSVEGGDYAIPTVSEMVMASVIRSEMELKLNQNPHMKYDDVLTKMENKVAENQISNEDDLNLKQTINVKNSMNNF